jgi:hypothetical protein
VDLSELSHDLGLKQTILGGVGFAARFLQSGDTNFELPSSALDSGSVLERFTGAEVIAPAERIIQRTDTTLLGQVKIPKADPSFDLIESDNSLHQIITALFRDAESTRKRVTRALEIAPLGVEHPEVVEHPGNGFVVVRLFERIQARAVTLISGPEISGNAGEHAAILLDHSEQAVFAGLFREKGGAAIELFSLYHVTAALRDGGEAVHCVSATCGRTAAFGGGETAGVALVGSSGLTALAEEGSLPAEHIGDKSAVTQLVEFGGGVTVEAEGARGIAGALSRTGLFCYLSRASVRIRHDTRE